MNSKALVLFLLIAFLFNCKQEAPELTADMIIDKAIEVSGGDLFGKATIDFDFRNRHYKAIRNKGEFQFERKFSDSLGIFKDVLSNSGFKRFLNDEPFKVEDTMAVKYARSVNSVHYFSILPFGLNDAAVNKTFLGKLQIKGKDHFKVKVTFSEEGGGEDFEDVFMYYVNTKTYKVDYFSYLYYVDGGGIRFREAYNERYVNGLRFVDYKNFKPENPEADLNILDSLYNADALKLLSKVELENITVNIQSN